MKHHARMLLIVLVAFASFACTAAVQDPLEFREGTTSSSDGVAIHYREGGSGETSLVFVHGWTADSSVWESTMEVFAPTFRVVALDLAGHGSSGRDRKDWTVEHFADDICAVVQVLDLENVVLIGHSMSGTITVAAGNRLGQRTKALIPVDSLLDAEWDMPEETWAQFFAGLRADFPANVESFFRTRLTAPASPKPVIDAIVAKARLADPSIAVPMLERSRAYDLKAGLALLNVPIHAVNSDLSPTRLETNRKYAAHFEVEILPAVGHWPHLEAPERFVDALTKVLGGLKQKRISHTDIHDRDEQRLLRLRED